MKSQPGQQSFEVMQKWKKGAEWDEITRIAGSKIMGSLHDMIPYAITWDNISEII